MNYRLMTRETKGEWEPGVEIMTKPQLAKYISNLENMAHLAHFKYRGNPVFFAQLGADELLYFSYGKIQ